MRYVFIMSDDDKYTTRLEKIIDKQDGLLNHYDAKFNQQNSLNKALSNQNKILKEDLQKHKNLLKESVGGYYLSLNIFHVLILLNYYHVSDMNFIDLITE